MVCTCLAKDFVQLKHPAHCIQCGSALEKNKAGEIKRFLCKMAEQDDTIIRL